MLQLKSPRFVTHSTTTANIVPPRCGMGKVGCMQPNLYPYIIERLYPRDPWLETRETLFTRHKVPMKLEYDH